jgi:molybdopterin/thiamine biosynthesis adenylyltransferase/rhodanese-related sulfurtransferase
MNSNEEKRYKRHTMLPAIGEAGQLKFQHAKILVIGVGGLGCPVLQYLAAAGIGTLGIIDFDIVEESNLQRQILFNDADLGKPKALCAAEKLRVLNPFLNILPYNAQLNTTNALNMIRAYDLVVDGSDNFRTRFLVNDACVLLGKPLVFGSVYQFEGQVTVFNYLGGPTYRCLYPEPNDIGSCAETGVLGILPGTIGCLMATEVLKIVSGVGEVLSGKLLVYDALRGSFNSFSYQGVEKNKQIRELLPYEEQCETVPEITASELRMKLQANEPLKIIDVREEHEYAAGNLSGTLIPLGKLLENLELIPRDMPVILHCQSGSRSRKAVMLLQENGFTNVWSLQGGIQRYFQD